MYNKIERSRAYLRALMDWIRRTYPVDPEDISPARRGFFGETWRLDTPDGPYFLKLNYSPYRELYAGGFSVLERLRANGIGFVSEIVKANDGALFKRWDNAVLGVFRWIDGENAQDERTKREEYRMLAKIYAVNADGLPIRAEDFSARAERVYLNQYARLARDNHQTSARIVRLFDSHREKFDRRGDRLRMFADRCANDTSPRFITHGDAGGNIIVNGDRYALVDWDNPVLAPPERDAWMGALWYDWARDAFEKAMLDEGVSYTINMDRAAYYCYHSFFWYLTEYVEAYFQLRDMGRDWAETLSTYFSCWIEEGVRRADAIP
ncbi:MAG: aminoglycoside phosphotransferase family protein [Oscillospiraceae bacterium]|jgi:hypothetical protein|nr:aminoglycoside phosphotransferase family protein [Oscillospiraceae bacterium]